MHPTLLAASITRTRLQTLVAWDGNRLAYPHLFIQTSVKYTVSARTHATVRIPLKEIQDSGQKVVQEC